MGIGGYPSSDSQGGEGASTPDVASPGSVYRPLPDTNFICLSLCPTAIFQDIDSDADPQFALRSHFGLKVTVSVASPSLYKT